MVPFPLWLNLLLPLAFCGLGWLHASRLLRRWPDLSPTTVLKRAPALYAILVPPALLYVAQLLLIQTQPQLMWRLPLPLQYWFVSLMWGWVIALFSHLFALILILAFRSKHEQRKQLVVVALLGLAAVEVGQYQYTRPLAPLLGERATEEGVVLQTNDSSCAAASGANIARRFGLDATERGVAEAMRASIMGTAPAQVIYGMGRLGVICSRFELESWEIADIPTPSMLFVDQRAAGPEGHAVAYMGDRDGRAEIWDPLFDRLLMDREELGEIWHGRGIGCVPATN